MSAKTTAIHQNEPVIRFCSRQDNILRSNTGNHYLITRFLAKGGMGHVYEACNEMAQKFAIKMLQPHANRSQRLSLINEIACIDKVTSNHVIPLISKGIDQFSNPWFATKRYQGTLEEMPLERMLQRSQALTLLNDVATGLRSLHASGIFHRDLKPSNVFIDSQGRCCIGDLGSSRLQDNTTLTEDVYCTLLYTAPEVLSSKAWPAQQSAVDVWGVGVIAHFLLCNKTLPFETVDQILTGTPAYEHELESVGPFVQLLKRCLAKEPRKRYRGAEDILVELNRIKMLI